MGDGGWQVAGPARQGDLEGGSVSPASWIGGMQQEMQRSAYGPGPHLLPLYDRPPHLRRLAGESAVPVGSPAGQPAAKHRTRQSLLWLAAGSTTKPSTWGIGFVLCEAVCCRPEPSHIHPNL